jgi:drug/metabolite transporter (DMT)-like permease
MELFVILSGIIISVFGILFLLKKPEYQFEKTTNGKMVKFLDYTETTKLKRNRLYGILLLILSIIVIGIGIYIMLLDK